MNRMINQMTRWHWNGRLITLLLESNGPGNVVCHRRSSARALELELPHWMEVLAPLRTVSLIPDEDAGESSTLRTSVLPAIVKTDKKPPAVTKILSDSQDEESFDRLMKWKKKKIKELGAEGFQKLNRETLNRGISFHALVHRFLENREEPDWERASPKSLRLFKSALPELLKVERFVTGEVFTTNPLLFYRGKIDTIVVIDDELTLMEWKTSSKPKPSLASTYDAPIQAAAYIGALNRDPDLILPHLKSQTGVSNDHASSAVGSSTSTSSSSSSTSSSSSAFDSSSPTSETSLSFPFSSPWAKPFLTSAKIVVCYEDGSPATVHELPSPLLHDYWDAWRDRLVTFWIRELTSRDAVTPEAS